MENKNKNLNITISNPHDEERVVLSLGTIIKRLKRYFLVWVVASVVAVVAALGYSGFTTHTNKAPLNALISFSYNGIEKGLDPNGMKLDVNMVKAPAVIESALTELDMDLTLLEGIRRGITFEGLRPKDAIDRLTIYDSVLEKSGSISAADKMLETSYFPTQFKVYFNYNDLELEDDEAVAVFNEILNNFTDHFYEQYGYNENLGSAVEAISYTDYDYAEAIDVFSNSINTLRRYVQDLAQADQTRFRSTVTGYTFDDLYSALNTVKSIDLDMISSYVVINNLTKNKDETLAYYEFRIKSLVRERDSLEEELKAYEDAIAAYEKDQVIVFGDVGETNTQTSVASAQYDKMFTQKNSVAVSLATVKQNIDYYKDRQQSIKSNTTATKAMYVKVEEDLAALDVKIKELVQLVYDTSEDYYRNVTFKNAYNVLVPAANTSSDVFSRFIKNTILPLVLLEALCLFVYFAVAVVQALIIDNRKAKKLALAEGGDGDDDDDDDDNTADEAEEEVKEEAKEVSKTNKKTNNKKRK